MSLPTANASISEDNLNGNDESNRDEEYGQNEESNDNQQRTLVNSELRENLQQEAHQGNEVSLQRNEDQSTGITGSDTYPIIAAMTENLPAILNEATRGGGQVNIHIAPQFIVQRQYNDNRQLHRNSTNIKDSSNFNNAGGDLLLKPSDHQEESQNQRNINIEPGVSTSGLNIAASPSSKTVFRNTPFQSTSDVEPTHITTETTASNQTEVNPIDDIPSTSTSTTNKPLDIKKAAIQRVLQEEKKRREDDLQLQVGNTVTDDMLEYHPKYFDSKFFRGESGLQNDAYTPTNNKPPLDASREVRFEEILLHRGKKNFIGLIGYPGSGKTTCSKRLAKSNNFVCFHRKFFEINYPYKLTLQELLLDKVYPDLDEATCKNAFQWIVDNQNKCAFIFDGFDQAEWRLDDKTVKESYKTPQKVQNLFTNLCNRHFLAKSLLIFTGRPHSFVFMPPNARPGKTIFVSDFSHKDAKKLFFAYAGINAGTFWKNLKKSAPQLISLVYNPLMCQLVVAALVHPSEKVGEILTMTHVFATVLENLKHSVNTQHADIEELTTQISRLAFNATSNSTVVISHDQLVKQGLDSKTVQDVIILLHARKDGVTNKVLFKKDTKLYFCHQMFQEYYSATHIKDQMPVEEFQKFVDQKLFKDHWITVRQFLCGMIVDIECEQSKPSHSTNQDTSQPSTSKQLQNQQTEESESTVEVSTKQTTSSQVEGSNVHYTSDNSSSNKNNGDIQKKRKILMESLIQSLERFSSEVGRDDKAERREIFSLWSDVFECRNSMLTRQAARLFPTDADLSGIPINDQMLHTLCDVIPQVTKYIERLDFQGCQMNKKQTHRLLEVIISNSITIGILVISYNPVDIRDIKALLPKVRKCLGIMSCFTDDEGRWRDANQDERNEIQDALNNLDNWELGVEVGVDDETKTFIKLTKQK